MAVILIIPAVVMSAVVGVQKKEPSFGVALANVVQGVVPLGENSILIGVAGGAAMVEWASVAVQVISY